MKITGYRLQHVIREKDAELSVVISQFGDAFMVFPDDDKPHPKDLHKRISKLEEEITELQVAQARYNLEVEVEILGKKMTLSQAVKLVGGAGRAEKMWRGKASLKKDRYSYGDDSRDKEHIYAKRVMTPEECLAEAKTSARWAAAIREAIQVANATEIEIDVGAELLT